MTTPPTPAGWYPDPDGSGGQRYWDGTAWTEHRSPATPPAEAPSEQVTEVVTRPEPEAGEQATEIVKRPGPVDQPTEKVQLPQPPSSWGAPPSASTVAPLPPSYPQAPPFTSDTAATDDRKKTLLAYAALCGVLLLILIAVSVYGFVIREDPGARITAQDPPTSEATESTESNGWGIPGGTKPSTGAPTADPPPVGGAVADGPLEFTLLEVDRGDRVSTPDDSVVTEAVGEFVVVHLAVTHVGPEPAAFVAMFQKLHAGDTVYDIDNVATAYLESTAADLAPGATADLMIAFDVPPGTPAESLELHADPITPGVVVSLS